MGTILTDGLGRAGALLGVLALAATACGDDGSSTAAGGGSGGDQPHVVATTTILGDITSEVLGDQAEVGTLMPPGADPHEFSLSAREMQEVAEADLLVVNGLNFEEGLSDVIDQAEDAEVEVFVFADHVSVLEADDDHDDDHDAEDHDEDGDDDHDEDGDDDHDEDGDDDHGEDGDDDHDAEDHDEDGDDDHGDEGDDDHDHGPEDPHIWTDPSRMVSGVEELAEAVEQLDGVDAEAVHDNAATYGDDLIDLDTEVEEALAVVPDERRVLVTNHEVFGYFADRYDFEVVGTVIPSSSTLAETSSSELEELADTIEDYDLPAIFAELSEESGRAEAVAGEVGDVEVVELYSESLGEEGSGADTYVGMMRTNADLIAGALG